MTAIPSFRSWILAPPKPEVASPLKSNLGINKHTTEINPP